MNRFFSLRAVLVFALFGVEAHADCPTESKPETLTEAQKREQSLLCQLEKVRTHGEVRLQDICVCNAQAGLPESDSCKRQRKQK